MGLASFFSRHRVNSSAWVVFYLPFLNQVLEGKKGKGAQSINQSITPPLIIILILDMGQPCVLFNFFNPQKRQSSSSWATLKVSQTQMTRWRGKNAECPALLAAVPMDHEKPVQPRLPIFFKLFIFNVFSCYFSLVPESPAWLVSKVKYNNCLVLLLVKYNNSNTLIEPNLI